MALTRVVVVCYKNGEELCKLYDSLERHLKFFFEVIFWSNDGSLDFLKKHVAGTKHANFCTFVEHTRNVGFSSGVNLATLVDSGREWSDLFILNPDAYFVSEVHESLRMEAMGLNAILGPRVYNDDSLSSRQASARSFPSLSTPFASRESLLNRFWPSNPWSKKYLNRSLNENQTSPVDWVSGCAIWVPRRIWERLKGFDESFFYGGDDVDLGRRAKAAGIKVFYYPKVNIVHVGKLTASKRAWRSDYYHHLGMWLYYIKWAGLLGFFLSPLVFAGIWGRFLLRRFYTPRVGF